MTFPQTHTLTPRQRRQITYVLVPTCVLVAVTFSVAHLVHTSTVAMWFDNIHWTIAYVGACIVAWLGVSWADAQHAAARRWFAYGMTSYLIGQIWWNIQTGINWNPYPAPSDLFFWSMGPCSAYGMWLTYRTHYQRSGQQRQSNQTMLLDVASFAVVVLTIVLALYLPRRDVVTPLELVLMIAYPVGMLTVVCIGAIMIPTLKLKLSWRWLFLFAAFAVNGAIWMQWNADVLNGRITDGSWLNLWFSLTAIAIGFGSAVWHVETSHSPEWERRCEGLLRMLPLLVICVATLSLGLAWALPGVPQAVSISVSITAAVMFVLAVIRQSLLLYERERMIAAEHRAGELEQTFRALFYATRDGLALVDTAGHFLEVNPACTEIFGFQHAELLTMSVASLMKPDHDDIGKNRTERAQALVAASCKQLCESVFQHRNGPAIHLEISSVLVPAAANAHQVIIEFRDITARKESAAAQALLEAQLRQSQKLEAIGTLASGIAHDFNNILSVILGNIDLASIEGNKPQAIQTCLQQARKAVHRARDLISRIVAFARPQESTPQAWQLADVIDDALKLIRATLPANVTVRSELPHDLPAAMVDSSQIFQILLNLCTNAYQAMEQQHGEIVIRLQLCEINSDTNNLPTNLPAGSYLCMSVKDNGSGIDPAITERIFEPFFTTKPVGKGSGLGLPMVHSIVRAHGGAITVDSTPGVGATFSIYLPALPKAMSAIEPASTQTLETSGGSGQRILCVDDEEALVFLLSRLLEHLGYRVTGYTDAQHALSAVSSGDAQFDLIITDLSMPGMSGMEFAREAMRLQPQVPIVMISGFIEKSEIEMARAAGIKDVLLKPDTVDELARTIHRLLSTAAMVA